MKNKGFTLIEILVVTTIIALLTSAAVVSYSQIGKQSRDGKRKADLEQIRAALEMYRSNNSNGYYIVSGSYNSNCASFTGLSGYISSMPSDPKSGYNYSCNITQTNYTLGAFLETGSSGSSCGSCGASSCNYCVGPYGQQ